MGLGPASTGVSGLLLESGAALHPLMGMQGLPALCLSSAEDKDTRDDEELVLSQCLGSLQSLQLGQGVLVGAPQGWGSGQCPQQG